MLRVEDRNGSLIHIKLDSNSKLLLSYDFTKCLIRGNYELRIITRYWSRVPRVLKRASFEPIIKTDPAKIKQTNVNKKRTKENKKEEK